MSPHHIPNPDNFSTDNDNDIISDEEDMEEEEEEIIGIHIWITENFKRGFIRRLFLVIFYCNIFNLKLAQVHNY